MKKGVMMGSSEALSKRGAIRLSVRIIRRVCHALQSIVTHPPNALASTPSEASPHSGSRQ